jgi:membrane protease YdiL (CAAX protease family)
VGELERTDPANLGGGALVPRPTSALDFGPLPGNCGYCGAPLDSRLYFCSACALPYQSIEGVVTAAQPMPLFEGDLIRRKAPHVATVFWTYFTTVFAGAIVGYLLFREERPDLQILLQSASMLLVTCVFGVMFWASLQVQFRQPGFLHRAAYVGLAALPPLLVVNFLYSSFLMGLVDPDQVKLVEPWAELRERGLSEATIVTLFCLYPAIIEEIAFRGLVQHWLQAAIRPLRAMILASFLFTVLHFSIASFPYLFAVGMLLGWTKWKTGSLYPSMLIHFLHNFVVIEYF